MESDIQERGHLLTEQSNPDSTDLDRMGVLDLVDLFHREDAKAVAAVHQEREAIAAAIGIVAEAIRHGGRLFYVGAGTSGRLGVLDAAECPPTFCSDPNLVQGILAGGSDAMVRSSEGLEDVAADGAAAIARYGITAADVVMGITAGGTTPYVHGALQAARRIGARTIFFACVPKTQFPTEYELEIRPLVGPEILAGSTRLKAGTATKLVLNTISTGVMVQLGKVFGNRMIDVAVTNRKLRDRALRILTELTGMPRSQAEVLLEQSGKRVKLALLMHWTQLEAAAAAQFLKEHNGHLRQAVAAYQATILRENS